MNRTSSISSEISVRTQQQDNDQHLQMISAHNNSPWLPSSVDG